MVDLRSVGTHLGAGAAGILAGVGLAWYKLVHEPRVNREREEKQIAYLDRMMDAKFQQYMGAKTGTMTDGGYQQQYQQDDSKYTNLALRVDSVTRDVSDLNGKMDKILDMLGKQYGERQ